VVTPFDDDPGLRERLRSGDPASSLPPVDAARVARILEDAMGTDAPARSRSPLTWVVAAAAAAVIGGVGLFALLDRDPGSAPPVAGGAPTVTELTAPSVFGGRCMVPTAEVLSGSDVAFDGTVDEISGGSVTLTPTRWYAGVETDLVTVEAPSTDLRALIGAVDFRPGGRYLVAASDDGAVMVCGFSAPYDPQLAGLYAEAFGG